MGWHQPVQYATLVDYKGSAEKTLVGSRSDMERERLWTGIHSTEVQQSALLPTPPPPSFGLLSFLPSVAF